MTRDKDVTDRFDALSDVDMTPTEFGEVWENISREMNNTKSKRSMMRKRPLMRRGSTLMTGVAAVAAIIVVAGGWYAFEKNHFAKQPTNAATQAVHNAVQNAVIADTSVPGFSGQHVQLVDVKGQRVNDPNPGAYQGVNWTGDFELRLVGPTGKVFDSLALPAMFSDFRGKFQFHFADYNGNGLSDFALGQQFGSNGFTYQLFEITGAGIQSLPLSQNAIFASNHTYSPVFQAVKPNGFQVKYYDNSKGQWYSATYTWQAGKFASPNITPLNPPLMNFTGISMADSTAGWATSSDGKVWLTTDGGTTWNNVTPSGLSSGSNLNMKIYGLDDKQAWVAVTSNSLTNNGIHPVAIFHTSDGGKSWSQQKFSGVGAPITLNFRNAHDGSITLTQGAAAGSEGETVYHTSDGGTTWNEVGSASLNGGSLPFGGDKTGASFLDSKHGFATGFTPLSGQLYLYQTTDGGKTWNSERVTVPPQLKHDELTTYPPIFFSQQEGILLVSFGRGILAYRTTDGGATWAPGKPVESSGQNQDIRSWSFPSMNDGFATDGDRVFTTTDGGQTWSSFTPDISLQNITDMKFTSSTNGWALMTSGVLYHTTDGGHTWVNDNSAK